MARVVGHLMYLPEDVRAYVAEALTITEECDPSEDLRVAVFTGALNLLSNKVPVIEQDTLRTIPDHLLRKER